MENEYIAEQVLINMRKQAYEQTLKDEAEMIKTNLQNEIDNILKNPIEMEEKIVEWIDRKIKWIETALDDPDYDEELINNVINEFEELKTEIENGKFR